MVNPETKIIITAEDRASAAFSALGAEAKSASAQLNDLAEEAGQLAAEGGRAAPAFTALAEEMRSIGSRRDLVEQFAALKRETANLDQSLSAAASGVDRLASEMDGARTATASAAAAQSAASANLTQAKSRYEALRSEVKEAAESLKQLRTEAKASGAPTQEYADKIAAADQRLSGLRQEAKGAAASVTALRQQYSESARAAGEAEQAERAITNEYKRTVSEAGKLSVALGEKNRALNATRSSLDAAGVNTANLATEQKRLDFATRDVASRFDTLRGSVRSGAGAIDQAGDHAADAAQKMGLLDRAGATLNTQMGKVATAVAGAFAVDRLIGFAAGLAPIADAASNLKARMRLAVGETGNLADALELVRSSANAAGADINSVGELYGRIASSTKDLGFEQERVAGLTDLINKSFVVSGSSAQATSGAITQLAQAFASGALRGDEFNSVNEAAPRLMDALAAGLRVARGELRTMAEQGKLTTNVVLSALESQRDAIERDFVTLPETVGRATQKLANEWQVFVGRLDESAGASDAVASGLTLIAENLGNIAGAAATAGDVVVAALAVKAAAALRGYITLTAASTAATTANAAALTGLAAAGKAATAAMLTLGRALPALGVAGAIAGVAFLVTKFFEAKSAAEDAEEAVAKLLAEPGPNTTADQIRLIATEAEAARFKLSEVERTFDGMRQKGQDTATALGNIAKAANIDSADGIARLITDLDLLRQGAQITGDQIQVALADRLKKLTNEDLQDFGILVEMAFNRGTISAQQLGVALDAQARAALQRLGVDADVALTGMSAKFTEAIGSVKLLAGQYDRLRQSGVNAADALEQGLDAALKRANNPAELKALVALIERLGREGKLSAEQVALAIEKIGEKADQVTPGINSVAEAFKDLRITSDAELRATADRARQSFEQIRSSGTASARELQQAFAAYAEKAIAANDGVATYALKAEASIYKVRIEADNTLTTLDAMGRTGSSAGSQIEHGMAGAADSVRAVGAAADDSAGRMQRLRRLQQQGGGGPGPGPGPGGTRDQQDDDVWIAKNGAMVGAITNSTEALFDKWKGQRKGLGGSAKSPVLGILNRAEQLGGLEYRKQLEKESYHYFKRRGMRVASFGMADYAKYWQRVSDELDRKQIAQERDSGRFEANKPRVTGSAPRETVTTFRVEIGTGAGRVAAINTASRADADALVGLLRQLEDDARRA